MWGILGIIGVFIWLWWIGTKRQEGANDAIRKYYEDNSNDDLPY